MAPSIEMSRNNFSSRSFLEIKKLGQITGNSQWNLQSVISKTSFNSDSPCINRHCLNRLSMRENLLVCMKRFWRKNLCIWTPQKPHLFTVKKVFVSVRMFDILVCNMCYCVSSVSVELWQKHKTRTDLRADWCLMWSSVLGTLPSLPSLTQQTLL